jgi:hypothetical protein
MKRFLLSLLGVLLVFVFSAGMAWAESPVYLCHTLTTYTAGTDTVTLDYVLHVENTEAEPVYNLALSHVPLMLIPEPEVSLNIGTIEAYGAVDVMFTIATPMLLSQDEVSGRPLFWVGEGQDANNAFIEFPADSSTCGGGV